MISVGAESRERKEILSVRSHNAKRKEVCLDNFAETDRAMAQWLRI